MSTPRRGFSVVELLVSAAVIGVLLSLALPAIREAREAARSTVCLSGVRQLHLGASLYADDHRDVLPPGAPGMADNLTRWHGTRSSASAPFTADGGPLQGYLNDRADPGVGHRASVRACPTFAGTLRLLAVTGAGFERSSGGYGYNNAYAGVHLRPAPGGGPHWQIADDRRGAARGAFAHPAATALFGDSAIAAGGAAFGGASPLVEYSFIEPPFRPDAPGVRFDPSIHFRHGTANICALDGHAAGQARTFTWFSGIYPHDPGPLGIGWFGAAHGNDEFDFR